MTILTNDIFLYEPDQFSLFSSRKGAPDKGFVWVEPIRKLWFCAETILLRIELPSSFTKKAQNNFGSPWHIAVWYSSVHAGMINIV